MGQYWAGMVWLWLTQLCSMLYIAGHRSKLSGKPLFVIQTYLTTFPPSRWICVIVRFWNQSFREMTKTFSHFVEASLFTSFCMAAINIILSFHENSLHNNNLIYKSGSHFQHHMLSPTVKPIVTASFDLQLGSYLFVWYLPYLANMCPAHIDEMTEEYWLLLYKMMWNGWPSYSFHKIWLYIYTCSLYQDCDLNPHAVKHPCQGPSVLALLLSLFLGHHWLSWESMSRSTHHFQCTWCCSYWSADEWNNTS